MHIELGIHAYNYELAFCLIQFISKFVSADDVLSFLKAIILSDYCQIKRPRLSTSIFSKYDFQLFCRPPVLIDSKMNYENKKKFPEVFFSSLAWKKTQLFFCLLSKTETGWKDKSIFRNLWIGFPRHKWMDIIFLFRTNYHSLKSKFFFVHVLSMLQLKFVKI